MSVRRLAWLNQLESGVELMPGLIDMTGMKVGELTVLEKADTTRTGNSRWRCKCGVCGKVLTLERKSLLRRLGKYPDCGCVKRNHLTQGNKKNRVQKTGDTLCWTCSNVGKNICEWDRKFEPVPGWEAEKTMIWVSFKGKYDVSYRVISCPLYAN